MWFSMDLLTASAEAVCVGRPPSLYEAFIRRSTGPRNSEVGKFSSFSPTRAPHAAHRVGSRLRDRVAASLLASRQAYALPFEYAWKLPRLRHLEHWRMEADIEPHLLP